MESRAKAEGKTYKHYVVLAHLGVDTTTPVEWRGSTLAEALSKNPLLKGKRVTVIDGHSHTVESVTYGDNVTYNQTGTTDTAFISLLGFVVGLLGLSRFKKAHKE